jgi:hypothetical protein
LWLGCTGKLYSYRHGILRSWDTGAGVPSELWYTLHLDRSGTLWAVSQKHVIALPAGETRFQDRTPPDADPTALYRSMPILEDRSGGILVDSTSGLSRWDGRTWQTIGAANGLTTSHITCMALSHEGDPWIGSIAGGLNHWTGYEHWEAWTEKQGLPSSIVWSFASTQDGGMLIGTGKGPAYLDPSRRRIESLVKPGKWIYGQVSGIVQSQDRTIWMSTFTGWVLRIKLQPQTSVEPIEKSSRFIYSLHALGDGSVWMATDNGVDRVVASGHTYRVQHVDAPDTMLQGRGSSSSNFLALAAGKDPGDSSQSLWLMAAAACCVIQPEPGPGSRFWVGYRTTRKSLICALLQMVRSGSLAVVRRKKMRSGISRRSIQVPASVSMRRRFRYLRACATCLERQCW